MKDWKFWVSVVLALGVLGVSFANQQLSRETQEVRELLAQQAQFINQSQQLSQFNSQFIRSLANIAAQTNDESIRQLLADNGVTYQVQTNENAQTEGETP